MKKVAMVLLTLISFAFAETGNNLERDVQKVTGVSGIQNGDSIIINSDGSIEKTNESCLFDRDMVGDIDLYSLLPSEKKIITFFTDSLGYNNKAILCSQNNGLVLGHQKLNGKMTLFIVTPDGFIPYKIYLGDERPHNPWIMMPGVDDTYITDLDSAFH